MGKFSEVSEYFDPGLTVTVLGVEYTLPLPSAELGLRCRAMLTFAGDVSSASSDEDYQQIAEKVAAMPDLPGDLPFTQRLLGDVYGQLVANKVPDPYIEFVAETAFFWIAAGEPAAERYWRSGGRPEAMARENRAARRATGGSRTVVDIATRAAVSSSGTTSQTRSSRRRRGRR